MHIKLCDQPFDPWQELQSFQTNEHLLRQYGATSIFIGTMRDYNQGDTVVSMTLEYYPGMTEKCLSKTLDAAGQQWPILDSLVVHRVGEVYPDQPIVLVAVWSAHRGDAFDACRYIMEDLKSNTPFWKKERLQSNQDRWVASNSNGYKKQSLHHLE